MYNFLFWSRKNNLENQTTSVNTPLGSKVYVPSLSSAVSVQTMPSLSLAVAHLLSR